MQAVLQDGEANPWRLPDLAAARVGGVARFANDEFFAGRENLLQPGRGHFDPDRFTERGKWMDGWETRRRREPGHDWCIVRLGLAGVVRGVDVDTNHFNGNQPERASLDGVWLDDDADVDWTAADIPWRELVASRPLAATSHNLLDASGDEPVTHVRLNIYPDGGVARLRVYGEVAARVPQDRAVDLACVVNGGRAVACNDAHFGSVENLILPGPPPNMGEGWETRRRRGDGYDWAVVRLACPARIERLVVDTTHFKGNYPASCVVEGRALDEQGERQLEQEGWHGDAGWHPLVQHTPLGPDAHHEFHDDDLHQDGPVTHVRLRIFPDGGVARLRVVGRPWEASA